MLTVVGIIAVLVAVSIPIVNSSLNKAQVTTDQANERAAKGVLLTEYLLAENTGGGSELYFDNVAGKWTGTPPTPYGKCEEHQGCYLIGRISDLGVVEMVWVDGAEKVEQPHSEGYGSTLLGIPTRDYGDFTVQGQKLDNTVTFNDATGISKVTSETPVTISNKAGVTQTKQHRIEVQNDVSANIVLKNVNIDMSGTSGAAAFRIADGSRGNVTITLEGTNILKSGTNCAGLMKNGTGRTLTIKGTGTLNATGGSNGAGIGGGLRGYGNNITISGGTVTATGGVYGAGIGGGNNGSSSNIIISGGTVTATGGIQTAGIGGGNASTGSYITISGGIVTATGGGNGAGIGGKNSNNIEISGGTVTATSNGGGAGIGGSNKGYGKDITITITESSDKVTVQGVNVSGVLGVACEDIGDAQGATVSSSNITVNGKPYTNRKKDSTATTITKDTVVKEDGSIG